MAATFRPIKRTALHRRHVALGAKMGDYHGWQVAEHFTSSEEEAQGVREGVGLADMSWMGKLDVKGNDLRDGEWKIANASVWKLARGHILVTCEPSDIDNSMQEIQSAGGDCVHITDVTSVYCALHLAGPKSRHVLNKLTSLDICEGAMPNLSCGQTSLAEAHSIVLRRDVGDLPAYQLLIGREYGEYIWDALMHAGDEFSIVALGLKAQRQIESEE